MPGSYAHYVRTNYHSDASLGYRSMAERTVEDFFGIISKRYEKGSVIITTNRELKEWDQLFSPYR